MPDEQPDRSRLRAWFDVKSLVRMFRGRLISKRTPDDGRRTVRAHPLNEWRAANPQSPERSMRSPAERASERFDLLLSPSPSTRTAISVPPSYRTRRSPSPEQAIRRHRQDDIAYRSTTKARFEPTLAVVNDARRDDQRDDDFILSEPASPPPQLRPEPRAIRSDFVIHNQTSEDGHSILSATPNLPFAHKPSASAIPGQQQAQRQLTMTRTPSISAVLETHVSPPSLPMAVESPSVIRPPHTSSSRIDIGFAHAQSRPGLSRIAGSPPSTLPAPPHSNERVRSTRSSVSSASGYSPSSHSMSNRSPQVLAVQQETLGQRLRSADRLHAESRHASSADHCHYEPSLPTSLSPRAEAGHRRSSRNATSLSDQSIDNASRDREIAEAPPDSHQHSPRRQPNLVRDTWGSLVLAADLDRSDSSSTQKTAATVGTIIAPARAMSLYDPILRQAHMSGNLKIRQEDIPKQPSIPDMGQQTSIIAPEKLVHTDLKAFLSSKTCSDFLGEGFESGNGWFIDGQITFGCLVCGKPCIDFPSLVIDCSDCKCQRPVTAYYLEPKMDVFASSASDPAFRCVDCKGHKARLGRIEIDNKRYDVWAAFCFHCQSHRNLELRIKLTLKRYMCEECRLDLGNDPLSEEEICPGCRKPTRVKRVRYSKSDEL